MIRFDKLTVKAQDVLQAAQEIAARGDQQQIEPLHLLAAHEVTIELTGAARELILREGYDPAYGARPLRRTIQRLVQDPLAMKIPDVSVLPGDHVVVDADARSGQVKFERAAEKVSAEHSANGSASRATRRKG